MTLNLALSLGDENMPINSVIGFFSSDARQLYIDDIVKVISFPEGHVVQFRYRKKYIAPVYLNDIQSLIGQKGVIVFTTGNILGQENVSLVHQPVRLAEIINIEDDEQTERVYFYLKLSNFCKACDQIPSGNQELFVKSIDQVIATSTFVEVADRLDIKGYPSLFTVIGCYKASDKKKRQYNLLIQPTIIDNKDSAYFLDDESEYKLDVAFSSKDGFTKRELSISNDLILLDKNYNNILGTIVDKESYYFHTASISNINSVSTVDIQLTDNESKYRVSFTFILQRNTNKPVLFSVLSIMSLVGITFISKSIDLFKCSVMWGIICTIISLCSFGFSAALLFKLFNKK